MDKINNQKEKGYSLTVDRELLKLYRDIAVIFFNMGGVIPKEHP